MQRKTLFIAGMAVALALVGIGISGNSGAWLAGKLLTAPASTSKAPTQARCKTLRGNYDIKTLSTKIKDPAEAAYCAQQFPKVWHIPTSDGVITGSIIPSKARCKTLRGNYDIKTLSTKIKDPVEAAYCAQQFPKIWHLPLK